MIGGDLGKEISRETEIAVNRLKNRFERNQSIGGKNHRLNALQKGTKSTLMEAKQGIVMRVLKRHTLPIEAKDPIQISQKVAMKALKNRKIKAPLETHLKKRTSNVIAPDPNRLEKINSRRMICAQNCLIKRTASL